MPGPPVMVCEGDRVVVDVENNLAAEVTSLHFHGEHFGGSGRPFGPDKNEFQRPRLIQQNFYSQTDTAVHYFNLF